MSAEETFQRPAEEKENAESEDFEDTTVECNTHWQPCLKRP